MENIIYNELIRRGYAVDVGVVDVEHVESGKRELRQHEIDFIVNTGFEKVYIQSAYSMGDPKQAARETLPLMKTGDAFRRMIVTEGSARLWTDESGVVHVGIIPFLLDSEILESVSN